MSKASRRQARQRPAAAMGRRPGDPAAQPRSGRQGRAPFRVPPPLPLMTGFVAAVALSKVWPWELGPLAVVIPIGIVFILAGLAAMYSATNAQRKAGTTEVAWRPSSALITWGPFRFSRHPAYVGFVLWYLGAALFINSAWALVLLPFAVVAHHVWVVRPEERLLKAQFGRAWDDYAARVRPWL